jgi:hypothetical protein
MIARALAATVAVGARSSPALADDFSLGLATQLRVPER